MPLVVVKGRLSARVEVGGGGGTVYTGYFQKCKNINSENEECLNIWIHSMCLFQMVVGELSLFQ